MAKKKQNPLGLPYTYVEQAGADWANGGGKAWRFEIQDTNGNEVSELVADGEAWGTREDKKAKAIHLCQSANAHQELLDQLLAMHHAADMLLANLTRHVDGWMPTESPAWPALSRNAEILRKHGVKI